MEDKKVLKKDRTLFNSLKTDPVSVLFAEELLDNWLLNKLKKSRYESEKQLFKLVNLADNKDFLSSKDIFTRVDYVEKRETDRSSLYSFNGPFQLLHVDVGNLEILGKKMQHFLNMYLWLFIYIYLKFTPTQWNLDSKYYKK